LAKLAYTKKDEVKNQQGGKLKKWLLKYWNSLFGNTK